MARDAFDCRWRRQHSPPEESELPPQLLAWAVSAVGPVKDPSAIETGWREWIVDQPPWIQSMLLHSVISYALQLAGDGRQSSD